MKKTLLMYRIILTLLSLLCFFLPGCNKEQQGFEQGKEPKKIYIGIAWVRDWDLLIQGAELAVADANASGGVLQKEIKLVINQEEAKVDDILRHTSKLEAGNSIKEYSREVARDFIRHSPPVTAVIGHGYSFMALPAAALYHENKVIFIAPTATNELLTSMNFDYVFRLMPKNSELGKQLATYCAARKFKRVAIFHERSE
ncbi:MAG: hypothetical protein D3908_12285 [Candidatus Electrothrix sp. AUS4]|nr:hypothetical protein [Candidatus Electrothrix sp. AUS4]